MSYGWTFSALALVIALAVAPAAGGAAPPVIELEPGVGPERLFVLRADSAEILTATPQFWGPQWRWAGVGVRAQPRRPDGTLPLQWSVDDLGVTGDVEVRAEPAGLSWSWRLTAARDMLDGPADEPGRRAHGGITFVLNLGSAGRRGCAAEPVLREDRRGWSWEALPGRRVAVTFSEPLEALYFERGQTHVIRASFWSAGVRAGERRIDMRVDLPAGGRAVPPMAERYAADTTDWFADALDPHASFVDLSFLNHRPAGRRGWVRAQGDALVFGDGSPARFWGANLQAYSLYVRGPDGRPDRALIERQARRLAQLGFNLVRITHIDSDWVSPNLIAPGPTTDRLDDASLDGLFHWVKALRDQGIYIFLDMITYRPFAPGDDIPAFEELRLHRPKPEGRALAEGFSYLNPRIEERWRQTSRQLLTRVNPLTGLALKDDPAVMGIMVWNENNLTSHFGNLFLADKNVPWHRARFLERLEAFARRTGLDRAELERTWLPGASKLLLNDLEYTWNKAAADYLRSIGVRALVCVSHVWGGGAVYSLPALQAGDVFDCHTYSTPDFLSTNPRFAGNFAHVMARSQVAGWPAICSEYNMEDAHTYRDPFTVMPYVAALAAFQGWDAPMLYGYSQDGFGGWSLSMWSSYQHPGLMGLAPAAALLYRRGDVRPARSTVHLDLSGEQLFMQRTDEHTSRSIRTAMERHRLTVGWRAHSALPWLRPVPPPAGALVTTNLDRDFIPPGDSVTSDTGELRRNWMRGIFTVNTPRSQMALGWIGGARLATADATFAIRSPKAGVALSSLDGLPLRRSRRILVSTAARLAGHRPIRTEPVAGVVDLRSEATGLALTPLRADGSRMQSITLRRAAGTWRVELPTTLGTHWFLIESTARPPAAPARAERVRGSRDR
ncbi:MAG TPA: hypothetical protein VLH79_01710 [Chthonomonadales bacterium]|nr:hypothetical protein [Chthonomonadales bacterium]